MNAYLNRILSVPVSDPDDARRRRLLNILLMGMFVSAFLGLFLTLANVYIFRNLDLSDPGAQSLIVAIGVFLPGTLTLYFVNRRSGRVAATAFLLFITIAFSFSDTPEQLINGRSVFVFTIPVVVASLLLHPLASFLFAGLSGAIMIWLSYSASIQLNVSAIIGFSMLALVSWLSSRSLEQALHDLRLINAELDQRVADRTRELSESLAREAADANQREAILNSIADGVVVFDRDENAIVANPSLSSLIGLPLDGILGRNLRDLLGAGDLQAEEQERIRDALGGSGSVQSTRIQWRERTLSANAAEVKSEKGERFGKVAVFRDVTREAELERMKDTFLAVVSHELRTPLNAILGFAEMIKETVYGPVSESQVRASSRIMENTHRLLAIVSELLDQAQIQSGRMNIHLEPCSPTDLLKTVKDTMEAIAGDKDIRLVTELDPAMPPTIEGDSHRLQQILINLTNNAIKFSKNEGEVHVSLSCAGEDAWTIEVADNGVGIPSEDLGHIFETFRQVESPVTRKHGGVGLGLAIVKQLVELMNGTIEVKSQVDVGSVFTVTLPLIKS